MATAEERLKILKMIQEGKISAEEGANLLSALRKSGESHSADRRAEARTGWLRVRVTDIQSGKAKVNVNLPMNLADAGIHIASQFVPGMGLEEIGAAVKSANTTGKILDIIDDEDSEHIEIFIE